MWIYCPRIPTQRAFENRLFQDYANINDVLAAMSNTKVVHFAGQIILKNIPANHTLKDSYGRLIGESRMQIDDRLYIEYNTVRELKVLLGDIMTKHSKQLEKIVIYGHGFFVQ